MLPWNALPLTTIFIIIGLSLFISVILTIILIKIKMINSDKKNISNDNDYNGYDLKEK